MKITLLDDATASSVLNHICGLVMAFYWHDDQLFARHGPIENNDTIWTTFLLDMREPTQGFTANLRQISVHFNENMIRVGHSRSIEIGSDIDNESLKGIFKLEFVNVHSVKFDAVITPRAWKSESPDQENFSAEMESYSVYLAARAIPTVERESIDLFQTTLSVYNTELL
ncbi:23666_t:CDS:2 [Dentiscutata erythropus]|uniref:23666_t:CDS:1 n=1 Tax=Dentiscutata erythropus TaxID=1348616 RepID=A0A9N9DXV0_9GLOM|nr:23666_t:CDS:2 [Dentiscutata erythropus]